MSRWCRVEKDSSKRGTPSAAKAKASMAFLAAFFSGVNFFSYRWLGIISPTGGLKPLSRPSRHGVVAAMTHAALGDPQGRCAACRCSRLLVLGAYTRPMLDFPVAFAPVKV